ncbi:glycoside hydrolase family 16 protein, partial [Streptomyces eurythermus]
MAAHRARRWTLGGLVSLVAAALVTAVLITTTGSGANRASAAPTAVTWSDDFDGSAGSAPDPAKWTLETGGSGNGNHELQYYTPGNRNAALDGEGHLVITARKNTDSGLQCWNGTCQNWWWAVMRMLMPLESMKVTWR